MEITLNVMESKDGVVWKALGIIDRYSDSYNGMRVVKDEKNGETEMLVINFNPKKTLGNTKRTESKIIKKLNKLGEW